ncbi:phage tail assembly protein [Vibrio parahaemolyticus]|nr:phage tail assembly protein [Vibrio parahaemolyticus]
MAVMTFELQDGFNFVEAVYHEVGLKELSPKDVFDAQMAAEKIGIVEGRPYAYTSDVQMGMELLCRQVEFIGSVQGPISVKEILKLSPKDFALLQMKATELDQVLFEDDTLEAVEARGRG